MSIKRLGKKINFKKNSHKYSQKRMQMKAISFWITMWVQRKMNLKSFTQLHWLMFSNSWSNIKNSFLFKRFKAWLGHFILKCLKNFLAKRHEQLCNRNLRFLSINCFHQLLKWRLTKLKMKQLENKYFKNCLRLHLRKSKQSNRRLLL